MTDYGKKIANDTVRFERLLPGPIERVWAYWTESEKRKTWFAGGELEPRTGGRFEFTFHNSDLGNPYEEAPEKYKNCANATMPGQVLEYDPPRRLRFTFGDEKAPSEVTVELSPQGDQVSLVLTHRKLADRKGLLSVSGGWHTHLDILEKRLKGVEPGPFWSTHARWASEYEAKI